MNFPHIFKVISVLSMLSIVCEATSAGRKVEPLFPTLKNITCFQCHSERDGPMCYNESQFSANESMVCQQSIVKGGGCAVFRFDTSEQATGVRRHSIERKCVDRCKPDCVVVGERHKLHLCTSCCNTTLCNVGDGGPPITMTSPFVIFGFTGVSLAYRNHWTVI
ncbi:uncharacterized protein LOC100899814 [Galendromus occidentalis]|uniref:Uncharacterized protein LOC100899814 n=1 Tax=Galendromus occidentalis TaxID=34638 RepID=A0AAJ6QKQ7_9ACAR|nr:uncharacterized protein LOC100899814 [Galendromus occidentalis]